MSTMLRAHCSQVACNCTRPVAASIPLLPPRPVLSRPTLRSRRLERLAVRAQDTKEGTDVDEGNVSGVCSIDEQGKRRGPMSLGEMEAEYLQALSAYYFDGKPTISDAEFETLRDELLWNGSKVAILGSDELKFLEATQAFSKGRRIMSDEEYDDLKKSLKSRASVITAQGPRCSIRTQNMYSDAVPDYLRMVALNVPAALLVLGFVFAIDDITGFEITEAIELPPPYGPLLLWGLLLPVIYALATTATNAVFKDAIVLKGPCPSCNAENFTYFGDILTVPGNRGTNAADCCNCGAGLSFDEGKRIIVVTESAEDKKKKAEAAAAKKAASAAKKKAKMAAK
mmetsp:Transcript_27403/g.70603  ORF Transcript_27403/g.70603 Transcript_27403/m.70603 type:complete len:341 (-) Transcript_27403:484-1506(-)